MKVLLFGVTEICTDILTKLISDNYQVCGLVVNHSNNFDIQEMKSLARSQKIPVLEVARLHEPHFIAKVKELGPDIIIVATYDQLIPKQVYSIAKKAAINIHPSYLPEYRGFHPYFWPIANGESHTGVSLHYLSEEFDMGDLISQTKVKIEDSDTAGTVINKQKTVAWDLLKPFLEQIKTSGKAPAGKPQVKGKHVTAPKLQMNDFIIKWNEPTQTIMNKVRALNPHSPAYASFRGEVIGIYQVSSIESLHKKAPGMIVGFSNNAPIVKTGDGVLVLNIVTVGRRYLLTGKEFVRREKIKEGESFA